MNIDSVRSVMIKPVELKSIPATEKLVIKETFDETSGTTENSDIKKSFELINDSSHWDDLSSLTHLEGLSAAESAQINKALSEAISSGLQSYDDTAGAVEIALKKAKLNYVKDRLIPERYRDQAEEKISKYISHLVEDRDKLALSLSESSEEIARAYNHTTLDQQLMDIQKGTSRRRQEINQMLALTDKVQFTSPEAFSSSTEEMFSVMKDTMLNSIKSWKTNNQEGKAYIEGQAQRLRENWNHFVDSSFQVSTKYFSKIDLKV